MRLIDADELITAFPCGESVRTESVRATINHMPTIEVSEDCIGCISREWVLDKLNEQYKINRFREHNDMANFGISQAEIIIEDAPSVVPSRAEGEWENYKDEHRCSECGEVVIGDWYDDEWYDYCPNCGSRMKGIDNGTVKSKSE